MTGNAPSLTHANRHAPGGGDPLTPDAIAAAKVDLSNVTPSVGRTALGVDYPDLVDTAIMYVKATGNDGNDGRSWKSAKLTIAAAISALTSASGYGTVMVGYGTFDLADTLVVPQAVSLIGKGALTSQGTTLRYAGTDDGRYAIVTSSNTSGSDDSWGKLSGFKLTVSGSPTLANGINWRNAQNNSHLEEILVTGFPGIGVFANGANGVAPLQAFPGYCTAERVWCSANGVNWKITAGFTSVLFNMCAGDIGTITTDVCIIDPPSSGTRGKDGNLTFVGFKTEDVGSPGAPGATANYFTINTDVTVSFIGCAERKSVGGTKPWINYTATPSSANNPTGSIPLTLIGCSTMNLTIAVKGPTGATLLAPSSGSGGEVFQIPAWGSNLPVQHAPNTLRGNNSGNAGLGIDLTVAQVATLVGGTSTGTLAAGDDSRITGAAQKASNLSDLASASTARTNLGLGTAAVANKVGAGSAGVLDATDASTSNSRAPSGAAGGDLSGTYPNPGVAKVNGTSLAGLSTGLLKNTTTTGVPSIATAADVPVVAAGGTGPLSATDSSVTNSRAPSGSAGGDLSGTFPNPGVAKLNGTSLAGLGTGLLKNTTGTGVPSIATGTDIPNIAESQVTNLTTDLAAKLAAASNLSDVANAGTARTNLGLGTAATISATAGGDLSGTLPSPTVIKLNGTSLAGLGTGLLKNTTGTGVPSIAVAGDIPNISESQVTNLTTDLAAKLAAASNLSDLASASTARTNLGLGVAATLGANAFPRGSVTGALQAETVPRWSVQTSTPVAGVMYLARIRLEVGSYTQCSSSPTTAGSSLANAFYGLYDVNTLSLLATSSSAVTALQTVGPVQVAMSATIATAGDYWLAWLVGSGTMPVVAVGPVATALLATLAPAVCHRHNTTGLTALPATAVLMGVPSGMVLPWMRYE